MNRSSIALTGVVALGLLAGVWWCAPGFEAATPNTNAVATMCGTVSALDRGAGEMRVITGVGHSLRLVVFRIDRECKIRVAGVAATLGDLERGKIVVVEYRKTPDGYVAENIETGRSAAERDPR